MKHTIFFLVINYLIEESKSLIEDKQFYFTNIILTYTNLYEYDEPADNNRCYLLRIG